MEQDGRPIVTLKIVVIRADGTRDVVPPDQIHVKEST